MIFRNTFPRYLSLLAFSLLLCFSLEMSAQTSHTKAASREKALQSATTPSDSIRILLDVYNLSDKINRERIRPQIITLAQKSDNNEVIGVVLKELSTSTDDTEDLERLIEISENLPEDTTKDNLQTILVMEKADADVLDTSKHDMTQQTAEYIRQSMNIYGDPYKEIQNIYRAMVFLGASSQGPLYFEYIRRLEDLVENLPEEDHAIKNLYYTTAAIYYTRKKDYKKAIELDRKLIHQLDELKRAYSPDSQAAKDLDFFYYVSYRRMLRNFRGLTPEQIEDAYQKCLALVQENARAAEEFGTGGLTNSYYYMATGQYDKAIPALQKALNNPEISDFRMTELLGHLGYAYRMTGNKDGELTATRKYAQMLLKEREERRNDMYREIELRNSVNKLINDEYLSQEKQRQQNRVMRKTSVTLVYVLALILIFMCQAYFRLRHKVKELELRNNKLHRNIEQIFDDGVPKGTSDLRRQKNRLKG